MIATTPAIPCYINMIPANSLPIRVQSTAVHTHTSKNWPSALKKVHGSILLLLYFQPSDWCMPQLRSAECNKMGHDIEIWKVTVAPNVSRNVHISKRILVLRVESLWLLQWNFYQFLTSPVSITSILLSSCHPDGCSQKSQPGHPRNFKKHKRSRKAKAKTIPVIQLSTIIF